MKSSSSLSDVCTSFISIVKAKLFWKIFLSGGEFTEKENVWGKDVNEKNRVVIPDKNLEADNCHWIEQELRRLQTWEVFLIKSSSKSTLGLIRILLGKAMFLFLVEKLFSWKILREQIIQFYNFLKKNLIANVVARADWQILQLSFFSGVPKKIWTSLFCTDADMSQ